MDQRRNRCRQNGIEVLLIVLRISTVLFCCVHVKTISYSRDIVMNIDMHSLCPVLKTPASKRMTEDDNGGKLADFYC